MQLTFLGECGNKYCATLTSSIFAANKIGDLYCTQDSRYFLGFCSCYCYIGPIHHNKASVSSTTGGEWECLKEKDENNGEALQGILTDTFTDMDQIQRDGGSSWVTTDTSAEARCCCKLTDHSSILAFHTVFLCVYLKVWKIALCVWASVLAGCRFSADINKRCRRRLCWFSLRFSS